jgi:hypothetical protein
MRPTVAVNRETKKEDEREDWNAKRVLASAAQSENNIKYE